MPARIDAPGAIGDVGDTYRGVLRVTDLDGISASADTVTVSVIEPDGTTAAGTATEQDTPGVYLITHDLTAEGVHVFTVTVTSAEFGNDVMAFVVHSRATSGSLPDLSAVRAYLGGDISYTDAEVQDALAAETAAQRRRCTIPADYPEDLAQALKRRVARNLAARSVPVASWTSFEGGGTSSRVPRRDAEIERLEAPYLRLVVA